MTSSARRVRCLQRLCHAALLALAWHPSPGAAASAAPVRIVVPATAATPQAAYFTDLLRLALQKTEAADGAATISPYPYRMSLARSLEMLKGGRGIDIVWTVTSPERERTLRPVRFSLLRELNDYRVFLIRRDDQPRFDAIHSLAALRRYTAGAGTHWTDADVLRNNGFVVATSVRYEALFSMLAAGRFDFFPRGLYEAWSEAETHQELGLRIETRLMLHYPSPFYFFVHSDNTALAERLQRGLRLAMADGSFDQLLRSVPAFQPGFAALAGTNRLLLRLDGIVPATNPTIVHPANAIPFPHRHHGPAGEQPVLKASGIKTKLWLGFNNNYVNGDNAAAKIHRGVEMVRFLRPHLPANVTGIGLYNHGDWFGEPENQRNSLEPARSPRKSN